MTFVPPLYYNYIKSNTTQTNQGVLKPYNKQINVVYKMFISTSLLYSSLAPNRELNYPKNV
ncbi:hypothetical protein HanIR_Chr02g0062181 [Helianthus annuus]|nr:hypothetical protein HanIR_Chr02g0062181 [Helianthus annuus]